MTTAFANPFRPMNPFLPLDEVTVVDATPDDVAEAREVSYALVQSGPAVDPAEVESHLDAIEVKVTWGAQVLFVDHLGAGKSFSIGEGGTVSLPGFDLKTPVVETRGGLTTVIVPDGATGTVTAKGEHPKAVGGMPGQEIVLEDGMAVHLEVPTGSDAVTIEIASVRAGKKTPADFLAAMASGAAPFIGLSFVGAAAVVASLAMFMPKMGADDSEAISRDQILSMQTMLDASAERERDELKNLEQGAEDPSGGGSQGGEAHKGESGAAGKTTATATQGHMAFKGTDDCPRLSREETLKLARTEGMVGMLLADAHEIGPTSPWTQDTLMGMDPESKWGALYGQDANDVMGYGLGLWGTGQGGGGNGAGVGIDGIGNLIGGGGKGPGPWGVGLGDKNGWGNGHGPGHGAHIPKPPSVRQPTTFETNGRLPPEVIQRIVRQNFGRFRMCYESALRSNPGLSGRVVTKFVIGRDGSVSQASDAGSDIASQEVIGCVVRSYTSLSFPQPEGGIATVVYPIVLSPGE